MSFAKDSIRTLLVRFSLIFVNIIGSIINARWLGPEGVGILALFNLINIFAFRFGNLGFGSGFAFFIAKKKATSRELQRIAWLICIIMSAIVCAGMLFFWRIRYSPWKDLPPLIFYLGLTTIPLAYMQNFFQRILSGQLRITAINISDILHSFSYIPLAIYLIVIVQMGISGAIFAMIFTLVISVLYLWLCLKNDSDAKSPSREEPDARNLFFSIWHYSKWNYLIMFVNFYLEQFPLLFLSYFSSSEVIGIYSTARGLVYRVWLIPQTFSQILFPFTAASEESEGIRRTNMLCRHFLIIMAALSIVLGIIAKPLIILLYGAAFLDAVHVFYALLPTIILYPLTQFLTVHVAAFGNPKLAFYRNLLGTPGSFIFCLFLVPAYGAIGAALSLSATYVLLAILNLFIYAKFAHVPISSVIIPNRTDWAYYKRFLERVYRFKSHDQHAAQK